MGEHDHEPGGQTVQTDTPAVVKVPRLRVWIWVQSAIDVIGRITDRRKGTFVRKPDRIEQAGGALDDVSMLSTLKLNRVTPTAGKSATWAEPLHAAFMRPALDQCHAAGIQLLAGYALGPQDKSEQIKAFVSWIRQSSTASMATLQEHADDLLTFLDSHDGKDFDGLSFDVQLNELRESDKTAFTTFYRYLAGKLAERNMILAVATGTGIPPGNAANVIGTFAAQPFEMAKGLPNFIIRPMAYDAFNLSDAAFYAWQEAVLDYGLKTVGLQPGQLQLGMKTTNNVAPIPPPKDWPPPGWSARKCCFDVDGVKDRCAQILRPRKVGVATFADWIDVKTINRGLNPNASDANHVGEPLQVPLTKTLP